MGRYLQVVGSTRYVFDDLKAVLACASAPRSGDELAGIAADDETHRVAARLLLADLPLSAFLDDVVIPYEEDEVTRLIIDGHDADAFSPVSSLTVGEFRNWLLDSRVDAVALAALASGLTPEMVAAVSKLMGSLDLIAVSRKCRVTSRFRCTIGLPGRLSSRLQPNHPTDDPKGILASVVDGLAYGIGDATIGINPATDNLETCIRLLDMMALLIERYEIPTQSCILTHLTMAIAAIERKAPVDLVFQSIAGSEKANAGFGIGLALLREAHDAVRQTGRAPPGANLMYFETGQGSALSSNSHHGVDQQTMEARAYAVAAAFQPMLVNTVVGFIGPEYLFNGKQIIRAGLEDHFCGKLLGLPMGADVCYTNHADADRDDMDTLAVMLADGGANFLIAVPGSDDVMLSYQSLAYHDVANLRQTLGLGQAPEFESWAVRMGITDPSGWLPPLESENEVLRRLSGAFS